MEYQVKIKSGKKSVEQKIKDLKELKRILEKFKKIDEMRIKKIK